MYCALLVAPDGEAVYDYYADTKEEVIKKLANRGSEWFFYPFEFVTTERKGRIVAAPPELEWAVNKSVERVLAAFRSVHEELGEKPADNVYDYLDLVRQKLQW